MAAGTDAMGLRHAAETLVQVQMAYARRGIGLAQAALAGVTQAEWLVHHPRGDVIDRVRGTQFYYHAHGSSRSPAEEHGHFHLFARDETEGAYSHLAALSLDARGWPIRWFATNRWVTGGRWLDAAQCRERLARFEVRTLGRLAPVARWLTAMVRLHQPALAELLAARDKVLQAACGTDPTESFFEDRHQDVLAEVPIDLAARLNLLAWGASTPVGATSTGDTR